MRALLHASTKAITNNYLSANVSSDLIPKKIDNMIPKVGGAILGPGNLGDQITYLRH